MAHLVFVYWPYKSIKEEKWRLEVDKMEEIEVLTADTHTKPGYACCMLFVDTRFSFFSTSAKQPVCIVPFKWPLHFLPALIRIYVPEDWERKKIKRVNLMIVLKVLAIGDIFHRVVWGGVIYLGGNMGHYSP